MADYEVKAKVSADIDGLIRDLDKINAKKTSVNIGDNIDTVDRKLTGLLDKLKQLSSQKVNTPIEINTTDYKAKLAEVRNELKTLNRTKLKLNVETNATKLLQDIATAKKALSTMTNKTQKIDIRITSNFENARLSLASVGKLMTRLSNQKLDIKGTMSISGATKIINDLDLVLKKEAEIKARNPVKIIFNEQGFNELKAKLTSITRDLGYITKDKHVRIRYTESGNNRTNAINNQQRVTTPRTNTSSNNSGNQRGMADYSLGGLISNLGRASKGFGSLLEVAGKFVNTLSRSGGLAGRLATTVGGIGLAFGAVSLAAYSVYQALQSVVQIASKIVMPGYEFESSMESARLGMAGTLISMTTLNGEAVSFSDAMKISSDMMNKLNLDAIRTAATTQDLVRTFQGILAPGIGAGMTLEEIREFTTVGVNAAKSMKLGPEQFIQELRDLTQGGIQAASSTIATALGLRDSDIEEAKNSAEGLFKFLMNRLKGFKASSEAFPTTFEGIFSQLGEYATLASAKITEAFGPQIKQIGMALQDLFGSVQGEGEQIHFEVNPAIITTINVIKSTIEGIIADVKELATAFGAFDVDGKFYISQETLDVYNGLKKVFDDVMRIVDNFGSSGRSVFVDIAELVLVVLSRTLEWIDALLIIADVILAPILDFIKGLTNSTGDWTDQIKLAVDALMGFFIIERIIGLWATMNTAIVGVRAAIELAKKALLAMQLEATILQGALLSCTTAAQALRVILMSIAKHPLLIALTVGFAIFGDKILELADEIGKSFSSKNTKGGQTLPDYGSSLDSAGKVANARAPIDTKDLAARFERANKAAQQEAIKQSQKELKRQRDEHKALLDRQLEIYKDSMEKLNVLYKQDAVSLEEYVKKYAENDVLTEQATIDRINSDLASVSEAVYKSEEDRALTTQKLTEELGKHQRALEKAVEAQQEVASIIGYYNDHLSNIQNQSRLQQTNGQPNIEGMQQASTRIMNAASDMIDGGLTYDDVVCTQFVVKSWDSLGLENALNKAGFDTNGLLGEDGVVANFRDYVPAMVTLAKEIGAWETRSSGYTPQAGDAIVVNNQNHVALSTGGVGYAHSSGHYADGTAKPVSYGEDYNYFDSVDGFVNLQKMLKAVGMISDIPTLDLPTATSEKGYQTIEKIKAFEKERDSTLKAYNELIGDVLTVPLKQLREETAKKVNKFLENNQPELAQQAQIIAEANELTLVANQANQNLGYSLEGLKNSAETMTGRIVEGVVSAKDAVDKYVGYFTTTDSFYNIVDQINKLSELENMASTKGDLKNFWNIHKMVKDARESLDNMLKGFIEAVETAADNETKMINANYTATSRQRENALKMLDYSKYQQQAQAYKTQLDMYWKQYKETTDSMLKSNILFNKIFPTDRLARFTSMLGKVPTLMDDIEMTARQSIEDGLVTFLTDGINEAESLSDALNDLLITVLKALQKMFAEKLVDSFMNSVFPMKNQQQMLEGTPMEGVPPITISKGYEYPEDANGIGYFGESGASRIDQAVSNALNVKIPEITLGVNTSFDTGIKNFSSSLQTSAMDSVNTLDMSIQQIMTILDQGIRMALQNMNSASSSLGSGAISGGGSSSNSFSFDSNWFGKFADGGAVFGAGTATSDSIPAMLSNGEFVVKAKRAKEIGYNYLNMLNSGRLFNFRNRVSAFAGGGQVGEIGSKASAEGLVGFAKNMGNSVNANANLNIAMVKDETQAIEHFMKSGRGQQVFVDLTRQNSKAINRTLKME